MPKTELTHEFVARYIKSARPFAETKSEQRAIHFAIVLNDHPHAILHKREKSGGTFIGNIHARAEDLADQNVRLWKRLILKELHSALCRKTQRYRKYVDSLKENANILIGVLAGYVASLVGIAAAVIAAMVAALLRLVFSIGITAFCKRYSAREPIA